MRLLSSSALLAGVGGFALGAVGLARAGAWCVGGGSWACNEGKASPRFRALAPCAGLLSSGKAAAEWCCLGFGAPAVSYSFVRCRRRPRDLARARPRLRQPASISPSQCARRGDERLARCPRRFSTLGENPLRRFVAGAQFSATVRLRRLPGQLAGIDSG